MIEPILPGTAERLLGEEEEAKEVTESGEDSSFLTIFAPAPFSSAEQTLGGPGRARAASA